MESARPLHSPIIRTFPESDIMSKVSSVRVDGHAYKVRFIEDLYTRDSGGLYGEVRYQEQEICINSSAQPSRQAETFLHELVHAISHERLLELDERQVDQIAAGLFACMVSNKSIFGSTFTDKFK